MLDKQMYVISVDMGTSSVRACVVDSSLSIIHKSQKTVSLHTDTVGKAEQDPEEVVAKTIECIRRSLEWAEKSRFHISAISFSNAVSSLVPLDEEFNPIGTAFTYADLRAHSEAEALKKNYSISQFHTCGCPIHASYWLPKFIWLKKNYPDLYKSNYFCTLKDLLIYRICGQFITDQSNAIATGLGNVRTRDWDDDLLKIAGVSRKQLPIVQTTTFKMATIEGDLPSGLVIVLGATDGVLSSLGAGAFKSGQVTTMIGSSGACRIASDTPLINDSGNVIWSYPLDESIWIQGGAMNSGGLVTQWAADRFYGQQSEEEADNLEQLNYEAKKIEAGADGLLFLPYLFGERSPIWNEKARGTYFGIHNRHERGHFARATLEGILFALYSIFELISQATQERIEIRATGGYLKSPLMLQIQADLFGYPVNIPANLEGSSIGAALLAQKSTGSIKSYSDHENNFPIVQKFFPDEKNHDIYSKKYLQFKYLYTQLKPLMTELEVG